MTPRISDELATILKIAAMAIVALFAVTLFISPPTPPSLNVSVSVVDFGWKNWGTTAFPSITYDTDGNLIGYFVLSVSSNQSGLYAKLYDAKSDMPLKYTDQYPAPIQQGNNELRGIIRLTDLKETPSIKTCLSTSPRFESVQDPRKCVVYTPTLPKMDVQIQPDPVRFQVRKMAGDYNFTNISIRNTGETLLVVYVLPPSFAGPFNYPKNEPQYLTRYGFLHEDAGTRPSEVLAPGEEKFYNIGVSAGNFGDFDVQPGTHTATGYVFWLIPPSRNVKDALFRKEFKIVTEVLS